MQDMDKIIDELTLMLLYLTSWQECPTEEIRHKPIRTAEKLRLTWKAAWSPYGVKPFRRHDRP